MVHCPMFACCLHELRRSFRCSTRPWYVRRVNYRGLSDCQLHVLYKNGASAEGWVLVYVVFFAFELLLYLIHSKALMNGTGKQVLVTNCNYVTPHLL
jgi:hypothetical protein